MTSVTVKVTFVKFPALVRVPLMTPVDELTDVPGGRFVAL